MFLDRDTNSGFSDERISARSIIIVKSFMYTIFCLKIILFCTDHESFYLCVYVGWQ